MDWLTAVSCGAGGGAVIEAVVFYGRVSAWQSARHQRLQSGRGALPSLRQFIDPPADLLAAVTRLLLGACAGGLFHSQVTGMYAAVAVGASAPALLGQVGGSRGLGEVLQGGGEAEKKSKVSIVPGAPSGEIPDRGRSREPAAAGLAGGPDVHSGEGE
jgi:hypothetical protein